MIPSGLPLGGVVLAHQTLSQHLSPPSTTLWLSTSSVSTPFFSSDAHSNGPIPGERFSRPISRPVGWLSNHLHSSPTSISPHSILGAHSIDQSGCVELQKRRRPSWWPSPATSSSGSSRPFSGFSGLTWDFGTKSNHFAITSPTHFLPPTTQPPPAASSSSLLGPPQTILGVGGAFAKEQVRLHLSLPHHHHHHHYHSHHLPIFEPLAHQSSGHSGCPEFSTTKDGPAFPTPSW